jgi:hypothetical protein
VPNLFFWEIMADSLATANSNVDLRAGHFAGLFTDFAAPLDRRATTNRS